MALITKLKGSEAISIDASGLITKSATWMLLNSGTTGVLDWLSMQASVVTWAGKPGDPYKKPVQDADKREASTFTSDSTYIVSDVNIICVDGRTHYEVTFSAVQNLSVMKMIGNVSVEINSNNERTKTITYQYDVAVTSGMTDAQKAALITAQLIPSGTAVSWAGTDYLLSESSYAAQTESRYLISFTAKDMSKMMIGKPSFSEDGFGQKTSSVQWRLSPTEYSTTTLPKPGESAAAWLGASIPDASLYLVSAVSCEPDGVLGYVLKVDSRHVAKRLVKIGEKRTWNVQDGHKTTASLTYQSDEANKEEFKNRVGQEAVEEGLEGLMVMSVDVSQAQIGEYEINVEATDDLGIQQTSGNSTSVNALSRDVQSSASYGKFFMEAEHCGFMRSVSNLSWFPINNPPLGGFRSDYTPQQFLMDFSAWNASSLLTAIKAGKIGYDAVVALKRRGVDQMLMNPARWADIVYADIEKFRLSTQNYAQPGWVLEGQSVNNMVFTEWKAAESMPIYPTKELRSNYPKFTHTSGRQMDAALPLRFIGYGFPLMDCTVTLNYRGEPGAIITKSWTALYQAAFKKIDNDRFTSAKAAGINFSKIVDNEGGSWTAVTCSFRCLLQGYWNTSYTNETVIN